MGVKVSSFHSISSPGPTMNPYHAIYSATPNHYIHLPSGPYGQMSVRPNPPPQAHMSGKSLSHYS